MDWSVLYYIASISTAYVGFTTIFIALRDAGQAGVDAYSSWSTRYLIAVALTTIGTSLLPPVVAALVSDVAVTIRISAFIAFVLLGRLDVIYLLRHRLVSKEGLSLKLKCLYLTAVAIDIGFAALAFGELGARRMAIYCALELSEVFVMFCYFAWVLERLLPLCWESASRTGDAKK
jgi:hypothetical protein